METFEEKYPGLTYFPEIDWTTISQEFLLAQTLFSDLTFPEYLQGKSERENFPPYLYEMAFYDQAIFEIKNSSPNFPVCPGFYLNPTAVFLDLNFDVVKMLFHAKQGNIQVYRKKHYLSLFKKNAQSPHLEVGRLSKQDLELLQKFEDGNKKNLEFLCDEDQGPFQRLKHLGFIIHVE